MNFQYFFFDTYPGFFLQVLPIALIVSILYGVLRFRKDKNTSPIRKILSCLFVCYIVGLFCLVAAKDMIGMMWYKLLYHTDSGRVIHLFAWDFNFIPDFWTHLDGETIGNLIMFLPFGILFPFFKKNTTFGKTLLAGIVCILVIECFQPVFGRAFDVNDIILNFCGVFISAGFFWIVNKITKRK